MAALKPQPFVEAPADRENGAIDDSIIQTMEKYFHVKDRDALLKYLRDTLSADGK